MVKFHPIRHRADNKSTFIPVIKFPDSRAIRDNKKILTGVFVQLFVTVPGSCKEWMGLVNNFEVRGRDNGGRKNRVRFLGREKSGSFLVCSFNTLSYQ